MLQYESRHHSEDQRYGVFISSKNSYTHTGIKMKKNHDSRQVIMDDEIFMRIANSGNIDLKTMKHIRKFNPHLQLHYSKEREITNAAYKAKRKEVKDLVDRHGKIVFLRTENLDDFEPVTTYTPVLLKGIDHGNKLRLRLRSLLYPGYGLKEGHDHLIRSYPIEKISRSVPEDYVYWCSGPYQNKFTETHQSRHVHKTMEQYLAQWNEAIR